MLNDSNEAYGYKESQGMTYLATTQVTLRMVALRLLDNSLRSLSSMKE